MRLGGDAPGAASGTSPFREFAKAAHVKLFQSRKVAAEDEADHGFASIVLGFPDFRKRLNGNLSEKSEVVVRARFPSNYSGQGARIHLRIVA